AARADAIRNRPHRNRLQPVVSGLLLRASEMAGPASADCRMACGGCRTSLGQGKAGRGGVESRRTPPKRPFNVTEGTGLADAYRFEQSQTVTLASSEETKEAQRAFAEKRKPVFR